MMDKADLYRSLKEYVVPEGTIVPCGQRKHCFYAVGGDELSEAEALLRSEEHTSELQSLSC